MIAAALVALPTTGLGAECFDQVSRIPMASSPGPVANARLAMARTTGIRPAARAAPRRPVRAAVRPAHVRKPLIRAAGAAKAKFRKAAPRRAAPPAFPAPVRTSVAAARWDLAEPKSYRLITTTICETAPAISPVTVAGLPPPGSVAFADEGPGGITFLDGEVPGPPLIFVETSVPPTQVAPPLPPIEGPGPTLPPVAPPLSPGVVPEPGAWLLMIAGFGLLGRRLRRLRRGTMPVARGSCGPNRPSKETAP